MRSRAMTTWGCLLLTLAPFALLLVVQLVLRFRR